MELKVIKKSVRDLERESGVKILYACESGSRAWGFESADSDYDVRFIYVNHIDWYMSVDIDVKRDVIEKPIDGDLDINGWELRKSLKLLKKSNPPLLEWFGSPIVYKKVDGFYNEFKKLMPKVYNPRACHYHYLNMAKKNYREYLRGDIVWIKKYFYVLRPILAVKWIEGGYGVVPMEFMEIVNKVVENKRLKRAIENLVKRKKTGEELKRGKKISIISEYITKEIDKYESMQIEYEIPGLISDEIDNFYRKMIKKYAPN